MAMETIARGMCSPLRAEVSRCDVGRPCSRIDNGYGPVEVYPSVFIAGYFWATLTPATWARWEGGAA